MKRIRQIILVATACIVAAGRAQAQCGTTGPVLQAPDPQPGDYFFGNAIAISGNLALVGAWEYRQTAQSIKGVAYVFDATTGALQATLENPGDFLFGLAVAIDGDLAVVGTYSARKVYVFNARTGELLTTIENPEDDFTFGRSVAISGELVVVGAAGGFSSGPGLGGRAYVFHSRTGALQAALNNPAPNKEDNFGNSVAISGSVAVVGAYRDNPHQLAAGASYRAGRAFVFNARNGLPHAILENPAPTEIRFFGKSVAISGYRIVVGATNDEYDSYYSLPGMAFIFDYRNGLLVATLNDPDSEPGDLFGLSVGISGNLAVVADRMADNFDGGGYVYDVRTGGLVTTLSSPVVGGGSGFANSVAISGGLVAVGEQEATTDGEEFAGAAYVFGCQQPTPMPTPSAAASSSPTQSSTPSAFPSATPMASAAAGWERYE